MNRIFSDGLEEDCKLCEGKGYTEVFSERFHELVEDLELVYPTYEQALTIARDKYAEEISKDTCPDCNGAKVVPNKNGKILISNKDKIVEFFQKQELI